jgi:hypothetical protein
LYDAINLLQQKLERENPRPVLARGEVAEVTE